MSLIKAIRQQLGLSTTPANNFTLDASAADGTMKLARGNAGATTQDIMTVDAAGKVAFPQLGQSLTQNGYAKLPGGLIIQWGAGASASAAGNQTINFPIAFPTACLRVMVSSLGANAISYTSSNFLFISSTTSQVTVYRTTADSTVGQSPLYIAVGY